MHTTDFLERIHIDHQLPTPPYQQLTKAISERVRWGDLESGHRLPSIAQFTEATGLSYNTVVRALGEVSRAGLIETKRGSGTFVLDRPCFTTELLIHSDKPSSFSKRTAYFGNVIHGLEAGFNDVKRRISLSYSGGHALSVQEMRAVIQARRADSLVVYHPEGPVADIVRSLAQEMPVVTLFCPCPDSASDTVTVAVDVVLEQFLRKRLDQGHRRFLCAFDSTVDAAPQTPYGLMHEAFVRTMRAAGIEPECHFAVRGDEGANARLVAALQGLPDDAVVVAHTATVPLSLNRNYEVISYTDFDFIVDKQAEEIASGRLTLLFADVTRSAAMGARLITDRLTGRAHGAPRSVSLEPAVISNVSHPRSGAVPSRAAVAAASGVT